MSSDSLAASGAESSGSDLAHDGQHGTGSIGHEHADVTGGWLRPAVFGAMDGLVSNAPSSPASPAAPGRIDPDRPGRPCRSRGRRLLDGGGRVHLGGQPGRVGSGRDRQGAPRAHHRRPTLEEAELAAMYAAKGLDARAGPGGRPAAARRRRQTRSPSTRARSSGSTATSLPSPWVAAGSSLRGLRRRCRSSRCCRTSSGASSVLPGMLLTLLALFLCGAVVDAGHQPQLVVRGRAPAGARHARARRTYGFGSLVGGGLG